MPDLIKASQDNKDKMAFIGINLNETPEEVKGFVNEFKVPYPIIIDNTGDLVYKYRVRGHPSTIFINKEGVITGIVAGLLTPQSLEQEIAKVLK